MSVTSLILVLVAVSLVGVAIALARGADRRREALLAHQRRAAQLRSVLEAVPRRSLGPDVARVFLSEMVRHLDACRVGGVLEPEGRAQLDEARRGLGTLEKDLAAADPPPAQEADAVEMRRVLGSAVMLIERMQAADELPAPRATTLIQHVKYGIVRSRLQSWYAQAREARAAGEPAREAGIWRRAMEDAVHLPTDEAAAQRKRLLVELDRAEFEGRLRAISPPERPDTAPDGAAPDSAAPAAPATPTEATAASEMPAASSQTGAEPSPAPSRPRIEPAEFELSWDSGLPAGTQARAPFRTPGRRSGGRPT